MEDGWDGKRYKRGETFPHLTISPHRVSPFSFHRSLHTQHILSSLPRSTNQAAAVPPIGTIIVAQELDDVTTLIVVDTAGEVKSVTSMTKTLPWIALLSFFSFFRPPLPSNLLLPLSLSSKLYLEGYFICLKSLAVISCNSQLKEEEETKRALEEEQ